MASARSVISKTPATPEKPPRIFGGKFKRHGSITDAEKSMVAQFVADQPAEVTPSQVTALSKVMRRSKEAIKTLIEEARETLQANLKDYVDIHKQATLDALATGDVRGMKVATEAAQWAMENIGMDGVRAVEQKKQEVATGPRIMIGVHVGGMKNPVTEVPIPVTATVVETK